MRISPSQDSNPRFPSRGRKAAHVLGKLDDHRYLVARNGCGGKWISLKTCANTETTIYNLGLRSEQTAQSHQFCNSVKILSLPMEGCCARCLPDMLHPRFQVQMWFSTPVVNSLCKQAQQIKGTDKERFEHNLSRCCQPWFCSTTLG